MLKKTLFISLGLLNLTNSPAVSKEPIELFHAVVFGINQSKKFTIEPKDIEQLFGYNGSVFFKSLDKEARNPYSWVYPSKTRANEQGYILLGYEDKNKDIIRQAGVQLGTNSLQEPPPPPASAPAVETPTATPPAVTPGANATKKPQKATPKAQQPEEKKAVRTQYVPYVQKTDDDKTVLLDLKIMCTQDVKKALTKDDIAASMPGGTVYGSAFDMGKYKSCYILAKKYKNDAPQPEITETLQKIFAGILGTDGIFNL